MSQLFSGKDIASAYKWLIFKVLLQLWADVKYHVPTRVIVLCFVFGSIHDLTTMYNHCSNIFHLSLKTPQKLKNQK